MIQQYKLGLVIPCYNEEKKFDFESYSRFLKENEEVIVCFINDGSKDNTQEILQKVKILFSNALVIQKTSNQGKAEAVRTGVLHLIERFNVSHLAFLDADLSTPFSEVNRLLSIIESNEKLHFLFGSRVLVFGKAIKRSAYRHYFGRVVATLISVTLNLAIYDTQCGLKLFRRDTAVYVFEDPFISRWLFDVEVIARVKKSVTINQLPLIMKEEPLLEWTEFGDSKIKITDVIRVPWDLLLIKLKYKHLTK